MAIWNTIANWFNPPQPTQQAQATQPVQSLQNIDWGTAKVVPPSTQSYWTAPTPTGRAQLTTTPTPYIAYPTAAQMTSGVKAGGIPAMGYGGYDGGYGGDTLNTQSQGGYDFYYDPEKGWIPLGQTPTAASGAMTEYQRAMIDLQLQQLQRETGMSDAELALRRQELEAQVAYQNSQLAWDKEQWAQQLGQEQKNYLANLAAEPHSWLEYAAASGQPPVIQPWMLPLMSQDYGMSAGQTIPGWSPTNMTGMPQLINPSAQYSARIGPTANAQYAGYEQARTGQTPEETQWRLWSFAPPSGNRGLTQVR